MRANRLKVLTFTTLYPSSVRPRHGIFVETRLRELVRRQRVDARVVAPVPWFPFSNVRFGEYARFAATPPQESRMGLQVVHPRYVTVPGPGMYSQPYALALGAYSSVRSLQRSGFDFDVIDAHYLYPDGVAAALLARKFRKPLVVTARGSDVNVLPSYAWPRRHILWAAREAACVVTVSAALKRTLQKSGVDESLIAVVRNGVDLELFTPEGPLASDVARSATHPLLVSVGNLVAEKGHELVIRALPQLESATLAIVGEGPERARLEKLAAELGVSSRVSFARVRPQSALAGIYRAADVLVLASSREGWPNVLLESMACGTPAVAADVGGVREIVSAPEAGVVLEERTPDAIARAVRVLLSKRIPRAAVRQHAERFGWDAVCNELAAVFDSVTRRSRIESANRARAVT